MPSKLKFVNQLFKFWECLQTYSSSVNYFENAFKLTVRHSTTLRMPSNLQFINRLFWECLQTYSSSFKYCRIPSNLQLINQYFENFFKLTVRQSATLRISSNLQFVNQLFWEFFKVTAEKNGKLISRSWELKSSFLLCGYFQRKEHIAFSLLILKLCYP